MSGRVGWFLVAYLQLACGGSSSAPVENTADRCGDARDNESDGFVQLAAFYRTASNEGKAVLSIRFRD